MNEVAGTSTIKFSFKREWEDQRLVFHQEGELSPEEKEKIWLPWTIFANLKDRKSWLDTDKLDLHKVKLRNPAEATRNDSRVVIVYEKEKIIEFMCNFDMFWYPFDRQSCGVQFYQRNEDIIFFPKLIAYKGPIELEQYTVNGVFLCSVVLPVKIQRSDFVLKLKLQDEHSGIEVVFKLSRPLTSSILTTFLPTTILVVITHIANAFSKDYLHVVIQVNLTVLLVLATL